ncbi:MAG TPA: ABC transporter substrate-binding protein [Acidimicrobiales bacterium]|nr:ABC transporter substrate-binding protein [Acidimicrobiales bacterium]
MTVTPSTSNCSRFVLRPLAALALLGAGLTACGGGGSKSTAGAPASSTPAAASGTGGTLVIAMTAANIPPPTPGGYETEGWEGERFVGFNLYDGLTRLKLDQNTSGPSVEPGLALSWTPSADAKTWTFKLRPNVTFTDGTPWNADAAVFGLQRILDSKFQYYDANDAGLLAFYTSNLDSVAKVDDMTVAVTAKSPDSFVPNDMPYLTFGSPTALVKEGKDFVNHPVSTGPFMFKSEVIGQSLTMVPNPHYWGPVPKLDKVVLRPIPDATARVTALRNGEVNWIEFPAPDAIQPLVSAGFKLFEEPYSHIWPWVYDTTKGPLKDVRVRQALNYAIDRDSMVKNILQGTGTPAQQYIPKPDPGYDPSNDTLTYNPAKAKQLLAEAGYPNGFTMSVVYPASGSGNMVPIPMDQFMQGELAKIGVTVKLEQIEWSTMVTDYAADKVSNGADAEMISLGFYPPDTWYTTFGTDQVSNIGHWSDPKFDAVMKQIFATTDPAQQVKLFQQMNSVLMAGAPWLLVVSDLNPRVLSPKVHGFVQPKAVWVDLRNIWVG